MGVWGDTVRAAITNASAALPKAGGTCTGYVRFLRAGGVSTTKTQENLLNPVHTGEGSMTATMTGTPLRSGAITIEIDGAGELGAATYKWRAPNVAANAWQSALTLTAASVELTTTAAAATGIFVQFIAGGTGANDFEVGDQWTFDVIHTIPMGHANTVDAQFNLQTPTAEWDYLKFTQTDFTTDHTVTVETVARYNTATTGELVFEAHSDDLVKAAGSFTVRLNNASGASVNGSCLIAAVVY